MDPGAMSTLPRGFVQSEFRDFNPFGLRLLVEGESRGQALQHAMAWERVQKTVVGGKTTAERRRLSGGRMHTKHAPPTHSCNFTGSVGKSE